MMRRIKLSTICLVFGFSVLLLIIVHYSANINYLQSIEYKYKEDHEVIPKCRDGSPNIQKLLEQTRKKIQSELRSYYYSSPAVHSLKDFLPEIGGQPRRSLIISTWRSGSTFLGQILNAMPANYYHYEPFFEHKLQIRGPPLAYKAARMIKSLLKCNFNNMEDYFEYRKRDIDQFSHNTRLWDICKHNNDLCFNADLMGEFCKLFPFQSMKLVRYRLRLVKEILDDDELNVRVILLIRDPRGVLQSRRHLEFCQRAPHCRKPEELCSDMISDYVAAKEFMKQYPDKLKVVRYEELALNPKAKAHELYKFLKLGGFRSLDEFLYSHTNMEVAGVTSTYRVTRDVPFKWKHLLDFQYVDEIQAVCKEAMTIWGYRMAHNATHMKSMDFYPVDEYSIE